MTADPAKPDAQLRLPLAPDFTLITGLSGAGRSEAAKCLEDLGYFVVDNLPPSLIPKMAELVATAGGPQRVAIVADARGGQFFDDLTSALRLLREGRIPTRILFLEASDEVLVNRFAETRRRHPLAADDRREEGITRERQVMQALRGQADLIVDTSRLTPRQLRERLREAFSGRQQEGTLQVSVVSFGYKFGIPPDADLVIDVRFLPNPYWVDGLRPLKGSEDPVRLYVTEREEYAEFLRRLRALLDMVLPGYAAEGKAYLTVAVGCTGGRHRSVVVAQDLAAYFSEQGLPVTREDRDLDRD